MATAKYRMEQAYNRSWAQLGTNSANCSGFLKSLQEDFGFTIPNYQADPIIDWLDGESARGRGRWEQFGLGAWTKLALGDWHTALREAQAGRFVVAALKASEYKPGTKNGHLAVVLPKTGGPRGEPLLFCGGDEAARSAGTKHLGAVWNVAYHGKIRYYVHRTASIGTYDQEE